MKQEQKLNVVVILFIFLIAPSKSDCIDEDDVDWGNYGYFQVCRSQHIKQALQVKIDILILYQTQKQNYTIYFPLRKKDSKANEAIMIW